MKLRVSLAMSLLCSMVLVSSLAFAGRTLQVGDLVAPIGEEHLYYVDEVQGDQVKVRRVHQQEWFQEIDKPVSHFLGQEQAEVPSATVRRMILSLDEQQRPILQEAVQAEGTDLDLNQMLMQDQAVAAPQPPEVVETGCCGCFGVKKFFGSGSH